MSKHRGDRTHLVRLNFQAGTGTGKYSNQFPRSADHEQDWQLYSVDPYSAISDNHTHTAYSSNSKHVLYITFHTQWHRPISKRFIKPPYSIREQPRSTRNVVAYPRPAFSAKKRKNYAPTSFDQQVVQVSQGHTFCTEENRNTEVHGGGGLELVKPAREPASSRPKPCAFLKKPHES